MGNGNVNMNMNMNTYWPPPPKPMVVTWSFWNVSRSDLYTSLCAGLYESPGLCSVRPIAASFIASVGSLMKWKVSLA